VVDGPFKIKSFDPATDGNTLVANPAYTGPVKPRLAGIDDVAFTSTSAEFDQLLTGKLDVGFIDFSDLPQAPSLVSHGYSVFGYPDFGFAYVGYNFKTRPAISTTSSARSTSPGAGPSAGRTGRDQVTRFVRRRRRTAYGPCRPYR